MQLVYGLLAIAVGTIMLKYNYQLVGLTGRQDWIERRLGSGSTYMAYKAFAVLLVLVGILFFTGLAGPVFNWALSPLKNLFNPS
jgi:hypothetical protein